MCGREFGRKQRQRAQKQHWKHQSLVVTHRDALLLSYWRLADHLFQDDMDFFTCHLEGHHGL
eukprot:3454253-Amphidinium_carterae.1